MVVKGNRKVVKDPTSLKDKVNILKFRVIYILRYANMTEQFNVIVNALIRHYKRNQPKQMLS